MKLCINCRYLYAGMLCGWQSKFKPDFVYGGEMPLHKTLPDAQAVREDPGQCSPDADWFEAKAAPAAE